MADFPTLPSGKNFAVFPISDKQDYEVISTKYESGDIAARNRYDAPRHSLNLIGDSIPEADKHEIESWIFEMGAAEEFDFTMYDKQFPPRGAPTVSSTAGGAKSLRTYHIQYSWYDSVAGTDTTASEETSIAVPANELCTVTLPVNFPNGVDSAKVYVGVGGSGTEKYEDTITTNKGTWTEPTGALTQGAAPASSIDLYPKLTFILDPKRPPVYTRLNAVLWRITLPIIEVL